jgi:predicted enzyme related to lactoylglutathione lyase
MPRVNYFAIPADEPERAIGFYQAVFGWHFEVGWEYNTPQGPEKYWHVRTENGDEAGINGGLTRREFPGQPIAVGVEVDDLEERLGRVQQQGGKIVVPKVPLPNVGWFAVCQDSEGNTFTLVQLVKAQ